MFALRLAYISSIGCTKRLARKSPIGRSGGVSRTTEPMRVGEAFRDLPQVATAASSRRHVVARGLLVDCEPGEWTRPRRPHKGGALTRIMAEADPLRRVGLAIRTLQPGAATIARDTMPMLVSDALASQDTQGRWVLSQRLLPDLVELDCVDAATLETMALPFERQVPFECLDSLVHQLARSRMKPFNDLVAALSSLDESDPEQVALRNLASALYREDEGAASGWPAAPARRDCQSAGDRRP